MCRVLGVHPSGFYAWCRQPMSLRGQEDVRQTVLIRESWIESSGVYGYRKIHDELLEMGEACGKHRVLRLMQLAKIRSQVGYGKRRPGGKSGPPSVLAPNRLEQQFDVEGPIQVWVTDITFIRTYEGWLYLVVVVDLFPRSVVGWSMDSRIRTELVVWR